MRSKQLAISASSTYRGCIFMVSHICCTASWLDRPGLHPKLCGSNFASHSGSHASLTSACVARSCMIGMPRGVCPVCRVCLSILCVPVLRVSAGPCPRSVAVFGAVSGFLCRPPQRSFSRCFPVSPCAPRGFLRSRTWREVSGVCGLSGSLHGSLLDRCVVGA
jgi:hypothetical protein